MTNEQLWMEIEDIKPFAGDADEEIWRRLERMQEHRLSARALFALKSLLEAVYDAGRRDAQEDGATPASDSHP
jgi:hypothetical protein